MSLSIGKKTDIGLRRKKNEDSYAVLMRKDLSDSLDALFVVADGMGGGRGGDVASSIVAQAVPEVVTENLRRGNGAKEPPDAPELLSDAIARANHRVWLQGLESQMRGMGTTCVSAVISGDRAYIGNVGDSRAYLLRDGRLSQISEDHSDVYRQVMAGKMTREEARVSKFRNSLTRAVGLKPEVKPDIFPITLEEGDTILLCSDGLTTELPDDEIARILAAAPDAQKACDLLVDAALRAGGSDNVTVVVSRYGQFTPVGSGAYVETAADDDTPTDPDQDWRRNGRASSRRVPDDDGDDEWEEDENSRRYYSVPEEDEEPDSAGIGGFWVTLVILLLVLVVGEGAALYVATKDRTVRVEVPPPQARPDWKYTDEPKMLYAPPVKILNEPLRDTSLQLDALDSPYVISASTGKLLRVRQEGKDFTPTTEEVGSVTSTGSGPTAGTATAKAGASGSVYTFDASSNRYQFNPVDKCFDKYDAQPKRVGQIAKGFVKAPTALAVDSRGNIFYIEGRRLSEVRASLPPETVNLMLKKSGETEPPPEP